MTQDDVVQLFRERAETFGPDHATQNDSILELAALLADSRGRLSKENFDVLVNIGALMYKDGLARFNARTDVAQVMDKSARGRTKPQ